MPDWYLAGFGAIGRLIYSGLPKGSKVIMRPGKTASPFTKHTLDGSSTQVEVTADDDAAIHRLFICVKAYDVAGVIRQLAPRLTPKAIVVLSHNGLLDYDALARKLDGGCRLVVASTSHGALIRDNALVHTGRGDTWVGSVYGTVTPQEQQEITECLSLSIAPTAWTQDMLLRLWTKLGINAAINPLTALHDIKNGALKAPQFNRVIANLCEEVAAVAQAEGQALSAQTLLTLTYQVIDNTAQNFSSMHQDMQKGNTTEIAHICGEVIRRGRKHGLATPECNALLLAIENAQ